MEDILLNLSVLKNSSNLNNSNNYQINNNNNNYTLNTLNNLNDTYNTYNTNINNSTFINKHLNDTNITYLNTTQEKLNDSSMNKSLLFNSSLNINKSAFQRQTPKQNNLTKVATSIIIDENLTDLNEKLKKANDFYYSKATNNNLKDEINSEMDINLNRSRSPPNNRTRISQYDISTESKQMHVSRYIKKFLNQTHEDIDDANDDIFKMKNCKINSKGREII